MLTAALEQVDSVETIDGELLERYRLHGDTAALEALWTRHRPALYAAVFKLTGNAADADDALQAAFIQFLNNAKQYSGDAPVENWMRSLALNAARSSYRADARRKNREQIATETHARETTPRDAALLHEVYAALARLPNIYRDVLVKHYYEGLTVGEVADALGRSPHTTHSQLQRGLKQLREALLAAGVVLAPAALEEILSRIPSGLTAAGGFAATASTTTKGAVASPLLMTLALAGGSMALAAVVALWVAPQAGGANASAGGTAAAAGSPQAGGPAVPKAKTARAASAYLEGILAKRLDAEFPNHYLSEVLKDLRKRAGLRVEYPRLLDGDAILHFEKKNASVREVLEALRDRCGLTLEYDGDVAVLWKKAPDAVIERLRKDIGSSDVQVRVEAASDAMRLADPRVYEIVLAVLRENGGAAEEWMTQGSKTSGRLAGHVTALNHSDSAPAIAELLLKQAGEKSGRRKAVYYSLLGSTRDPAATAYLLKTLRELPIERDRGERWAPEWQILNALANTNQPDVTEVILRALKDPACDARYEIAHNADALLVSLDPRVAAAAAEAARGVTLPGEPKIDDVMRDLKTEKDASKRYFLLMKLMYSHRADALAALKEGIENDALNRASLVRSLAYVQNASATDMLLKMLASGDPEMRAVLARCIAAGYDPRVVGALKAEYKKGEISKLAILEGLAQSEFPEAMAFVMTELKTLNATTLEKFVVVENAWNARAMPALLEFTRENSLRARLPYTLNGVTDARFVDAILKICESCAAAELPLLLHGLARNARNADAFAYLEKTARHPDAAVRKALTESLSGWNSDDPRFSELMMTMMHDADAVVAKSAADSMFRYFNAEVAGSLLALAKTNGRAGELAREPLKQLYWNRRFGPALRAEIETLLKLNDKQPTVPQKPAVPPQQDF